MQTHICTTDAQIHLKNTQTKKCTYVHMDTYMQTHMDVHVHTQKHPHCNKCSHTNMFYTNNVHTNRQKSLSLSIHTHTHAPYFSTGCSRFGETSSSLQHVCVSECVCMCVSVSLLPRSLSRSTKRPSD